MKLTEFSFPNYHVYRMTSPEPWNEHCYLVKHIPSRTSVLFDPGDQAESIDDTIRKSDSDLKYILLTHGHHDHVGALLDLCQRYQITAMIHHADKRLLRHAPLYALRFSQKNIQLPENIDTFSREGTETISFELGDSSFRSLHTPGHTQGSVCFLFDDFLISGDILFYQKTGRIDLPGGSAEQITDSITRIFEVASDKMVIFAGHGREWQVGNARSWWSARSE